MRQRLNQVAPKELTTKSMLYMVAFTPTPTSIVSGSDDGTGADHESKHFAEGEKQLQCTLAAQLGRAHYKSTVLSTVPCWCNVTTHSKYAYLCAHMYWCCCMALRCCINLSDAVPLCWFKLRFAVAGLAGQLPFLAVAWLGHRTWILWWNVIVGHQSQHSYQWECASVRFAKGLAKGESVCNLISMLRGCMFTYLYNFIYVWFWRIGCTVVCQCQSFNI